MNYLSNQAIKIMVLNESPSEKEGKSHGALRAADRTGSSMKVPPKRKGNLNHRRSQRRIHRTSSMKVPPKRKGNGT